MNYILSVWHTVHVQYKFCIIQTRLLMSSPDVTASLHTWHFPLSASPLVCTLTRFGDLSQTSLRPLSDRTQTSHSDLALRPRSQTSLSDLAQTPLTSLSDLSLRPRAQTPLTSLSDLSQTSLRPLSDLSQTPLRPLSDPSDLAQTSL